MNIPQDVVNKLNQYSMSRRHHEQLKYARKIFNQEVKNTIRELSEEI